MEKINLYVAVEQMKRITISGGTFSIKFRKWNRQTRDGGDMVILTAARLRKKATDESIENSSYKLFLTDTTTGPAAELLGMSGNGVQREKNNDLRIMEIRRSGNFGIIDTGTDKGLISFSIGGRGKGWEPSSIQLNRRGAFFSRKISVNGTFIVPMGDNNDMPGEVMRLLDKFYAGEGNYG